MNDNNFQRLLVLLLLSLSGLLLLYWLPDKVFGHKLKKVDMLSDIREKPASLSLDSLLRQLEAQDTIIEIHKRNSVSQTSGLDSARLALRDSLYQTLYNADGADSVGKHIEDYSAGHIGLSRFFTALKKIKTLQRPVRIAVMGDSFIEGDIFVADLRAAFQKQFGGNGVGFVPIFSVADQFRPTINQSVENWTTFSLQKDTTHHYLLSGSFFEPKEKASLTIEPAEKYPDLNKVPSFKLYYSGIHPGHIAYTINADRDTIIKDLPSKNLPGSFEIKHAFSEGTFFFWGGENLQVYGTALEENNGVVVDNFSLRGNSGLILNRLDIKLCNAFAEARAYDLIILQYGLNVVSEEILNYGWYRTRMIQVIRHIQKCFPNTDILLMGVSDRAYQNGDSFETMPAVFALLHAQRQIVQITNITFWNTFGAMGGTNSMCRFVENNWASKDYTHLSFRGGKEIAKVLYEAFMLEKKFYDKANGSIQP
ncbi:MAG: hypothetical protein PHX50_15265 [Massilibacteroides sp.]|nr:hypothetical protein [Massilibacteroides sp.]